MVSAALAPRDYKHKPFSHSTIVFKTLSFPSSFVFLHKHLLRSQANNFVLSIELLWEYIPDEYSLGRTFPSRSFRLDLSSNPCLVAHFLGTYSFGIYRTVMKNNGSNKMLPQGRAYMS